MAIKRRHAVLIILPRCLPTNRGRFLAQGLKRSQRTENLGEKWEAMLARWFLKFFLWILSTAFALSEDFRENIKDFEAKYVFRTESRSVAATVTFRGGAMAVEEWIPEDHPNATVVFRDAYALKRYLYSGVQDILGLILENGVQLDGNWNYVHKFLFMVNDLRHRLMRWK